MIRVNVVYLVQGAFPHKERNSSSSEPVPDVATTKKPTALHAANSEMPRLITFDSSKCNLSFPRCIPGRPYTQKHNHNSASSKPAPYVVTVVEVEEAAIDDVGGDADEAKVTQDEEEDDAQVKGDDHA